jgi:isopentenyl diphosphate isomerase/L-lactate dehydrogenase-like FMN-dependent dehydrogenase
MEPEPINVADYERIAAERLEAGPLAYFGGGAGDELTMRENVAAYRRWALRPRVLVDVERTTTATTVLGAEISMPILVAPVAVQALAHPDGEAGMARAAAGAGTIMSLSTIASARPAEVAAAAPGGRRWFQLYCFRDRGITDALVAEAIESGFEAIVVTVDAPRGGKRDRDLRSGFQIPTGIGVPSVEAAVGGGARLGISEVFELVDPSLAWSDIERLAAGSEVPVLVKGVLRGDDAALAVEHGAAGVVVSNHGGRQLDGAVATIEALPEVAEAVGGRCEIIVDGGVRRGGDVLVALALGATAVQIGRPALWGLVAGGEAGARRVLELLREELDLGLALLGCRSPAEVGRDRVRRVRAVL